MAPPRISVVIPTYNRASTLKRAIQSVLSQSFNDLELLVVDDASTDTTADVVKKFSDPRLRYLPSQERLGVSRARNIGIQNARGELVAFQDSDDEWRVEKLERQVNAYDAGGPDVALVVCGDLVTNQYSMSYLGVASEDAVVDVSAMAVLRMPPCPCWLANRSALLEAGAFDEQINCFEDWELSLRLLPRGRILMVNEPLVLRQKTPGSLFSQERNYIHNLDRILDRHQQLLKKHPTIWAHYCNLIGQTECQYGSCSVGRAWFRKALIAYPLAPRSWINLACSLFGSAFFRTYVSVARWWRGRYAAPVRPDLYTGTS